MKQIQRACALALTLVLASCGGGGGGGADTTPVAVAPASVAITETNAKPVAANALATEQNLSAAQTGSLATGVEVSAGPPSSALLYFARAAAALAGHAPAAAPPALATAATINQQVQCTLGGTMTVSGTVAGGNALVTGDNITIAAASCIEPVGGVSSTMNGSMSLTVQSGSITGFVPMHVVMNVVLTNFSVRTGGTTAIGNGDMRLDLSVNASNVETLVVTGTSLASTISAGGTSRTITLRNYAQTITLAGTNATSRVTATVETNSTRLGANGATYTLTTPVTVAWNTVTNLVSAGSVKVVGAGGSQLLLTVGAANTVTIQVDANGDGTYEKSLTSSIAELAGLL